MSYDLHLFYLPDGANPAEVYRQLQDKEEQKLLNLDAGQHRPPQQGKLEKMQALADSLKSCCPAFEQFQPGRPLPWIELTEENLQLQVTIQEDMVSISMPYFRERSAEMMNLAGKCIEALTNEGGFVAYDPQLERIVRVNDLSDALTQYHDMDRHLPDMIAAASREKTRVRRPWWKIW